MNNHYLFIYLLLYPNIFSFYLSPGLTPEATMAYQHGRRPDEASAAMGGTNNTHDAAMHHDTAQIQTHLRQLEQQNKQQTERITHLEQRKCALLPLSRFILQ